LAVQAPAAVAVELPRAVAALQVLVRAWEQLVAGPAPARRLAAARDSPLMAAQNLVETATPRPSGGAQVFQRTTCFRVPFSLPASPPAPFVTND
jgi:hypothetical protein